DPRHDGKGDDRGSRARDRSRRVRLDVQAGQPGRAGWVDRHVAGSGHRAPQGRRLEGVMPAETSSTGEVAILLVDDRPENLTALAAVLEPLGCRLVTAGSGREALKLLLDGEFAVILLDVQMPDMDGFETASFIRDR